MDDYKHLILESVSYGLKLFNTNSFNKDYRYMKKYPEVKFYESFLRDICKYMIPEFRDLVIEKFTLLNHKLAEFYEKIKIDLSSMDFLIQQFGSQFKDTTDYCNLTLNLTGDDPRVNPNHLPFVKEYAELFHSICYNILDYLTLIDELRNLLDSMVDLDMFKLQLRFETTLEENFNRVSEMIENFYKMLSNILQPDNFLNCFKRFDRIYDIRELANEFKNHNVVLAKYCEEYISRTYYVSVKDRPSYLDFTQRVKNVIIAMSLVRNLSSRERECLKLAKGTLEHFKSNNI